MSRDLDRLKAFVTGNEVLIAFDDASGLWTIRSPQDGTYLGANTLLALAVSEAKRTLGAE